MKIDGWPGLEYDPTEVSARAKALDASFKEAAGDQSERGKFLKQGRELSFNESYFGKQGRDGEKKKADDGRIHESKASGFESIRKEIADLKATLAGLGIVSYKPLVELEASLNNWGESINLKESDSADFADNEGKEFGGVKGRMRQLRR